MNERLTESQWRTFQDDGYVNIGRVLSDADLHAMQRRIDDIMLGRAEVDYDKMLMQLDSQTGQYEDAGPQTKGHKGSTLNYRKVQDLEFDPLFLSYMQRPIFRDISRRVYGDVAVACFRAMFMNKPAGMGTFLPWHQDRWTFLDRDPVITLWTALDPATAANGCVQIIPGSHRSGLINPSDAAGFLTPEQSAKFAPQGKRVFLELEAGEVALLHNWLLHASDVNRSEVPRRAFSVCYMDARTRAQNVAEHSVIFGAGSLAAERQDSGALHG